MLSYISKLALPTLAVSETAAAKFVYALRYEQFLARNLVGS